MNYPSQSPSPYQCILCGGKFRGVQSLGVHIKDCHNVENNQDKILVLSAQNDQVQELLKTCLSEVGNKTSGLKDCLFCKEGFRQSTDLESHLTVSHDIRMENSRLCSDLSQLQRDGSLEIHYCGFCDYKTNNIKYLKRHEQIHVPDSSFQCQKCESSFTAKYSLKLHNDRKHSGKDKMYACKECGKRFFTFIELQTHSKVHLKVRIKPFRCQVCSFETDLQRNLDLHRETHMDVSIHCDICEKKLKSKNSLKNHLKRIHSSNGTKHLCKTCGKDFLYRNKMIC